MKLKRLSLLLGLTTSVAMCAASLPVTVNADEEEDAAAVPFVDDSNGPIYSDDFEGDVISGWGSLGGVAELALDNSNGHDSTSCLKITGREISWHGPSISIDRYIENLEAYRFSGWVYHEGSSPETINCTLRFSDSVNLDSYTGVASITANPNEWTYFEGVVETPEDFSSTLLYFECPNETLDFCIDDIQIFGKAPSADPDPKAQAASKKETVDKYEFDFESGFNEWISRGDTRLIRTDEQQNTGNYSLLATNRQKIWNGPSVSIDGIAREVEYTYSANVLYTDKKADDSHVFLLELQYAYDGQENYRRITDAEVQKNVWSKLTGTFTVPEGATNVTLYVQTENLPEDDPTAKESYTDLVSFYVDDISAVRSDIAGAPEIINTIKNMSIKTIILIVAGIIALIALIAVVLKVIFSGSKENDSNDENGSGSTENVNEVLNLLDGKSSENGSDSNKPVSMKTPDVKVPDSLKAELRKAEGISENVKKKAEKAAEAAEKKAEEITEAAENEAEKISETVEEVKAEVKESKKPETASENRNQNEKKPNGNSNNNNKKKHNKKSKSSKEESREKEVFGIETFSYDDPDAATASDDGTSQTDSLFDGF